MADRSFSHAIAEGDGISVIAAVEDAEAARAAESQRAEALVVTGDPFSGVPTLNRHNCSQYGGHSKKVLLDSSYSRRRQPTEGDFMSDLTNKATETAEHVRNAVTETAHVQQLRRAISGEFHYGVMCRDTRRRIAISADASARFLHEHKDDRSET